MISIPRRHHHQLFEERESPPTPSVVIHSNDEQIIISKITNADNNTTTTIIIPISGCESAVRFLLLPSQVGVVLLLEFLNSFRSFGLRFVLYNYITNEFGIDDANTGKLLGVKGIMDIAFGLTGSILVDIFGVRKVSLVALSVAILGRTLLAFGRTRGALYMALFLFSPCGDALLSVGLYKVALKKLTTPITRPLGFALSYSTFNLAGAVADILVDKMRADSQDWNLESNLVGIGGVYTPIRQFIVITWIAVLLTWIIAFCFLEDWTVMDTNDLDDDDECVDGIANNGNGMMRAKPMVRPHLLQRAFPGFEKLIHPPMEDENQCRPHHCWETTAKRQVVPNYKMYRTQYSRNVEGRSSILSSIIDLFRQILALLRLRSTWRVLVFGFSSSAIAMNWTSSEMVLPPFLERRFGENVPIYTIQSINLFGCLLFPPFVGAFTSGREDFSVIMPGLWIMAISPIFVAISPNVTGACTWQVFLTIGEVLWSPRQTSWTASLAPTGSEGLFFAISSARSVMGPLTDVVMGAINQKYNSNCPDCRDQYGHFCQNRTDESNLQCASSQETCNIVLDNDQQSCPRTCPECPTWEPTDPSACWYLLFLVSLITPVCIWCFLPFLRGKRNRSDECYGILTCNMRRIFGICGASEDCTRRRAASSPQPSYEHVDAPRVSKEFEVTRGGNSFRKEIEIT